MTHPPISQQITFIYTHDLAETVRFYENVIGLALWLDQGSCRIYTVSTNGYIGICQSSDNSKGTHDAGNQSNVILTLVTPQVDEWYTYLKAKGVVFEKAPDYNPKYKIYHCFLRDPNGYLIEIQRFDDVPRQ